MKQSMHVGHLLTHHNIFHATRPTMGGAGEQTIRSTALLMAKKKHVLPALSYLTGGAEEEEEAREGDRRNRHYCEY